MYIYQLIPFKVGPALSLQANNTTPGSGEQGP